jgi:hypothetical protein
MKIALIIDALEAAHAQGGPPGYPSDRHPPALVLI